MSQKIEQIIQELDALKTDLQTAQAAVPEVSEFDKAAKRWYDVAIRYAHMAQKQIAECSLHEAEIKLSQVQFDTFQKDWIENVVSRERQDLQQPDFRRDEQAQLFQQWDAFNVKIESIQQLVREESHKFCIVNNLNALKARFDEAAYLPHKADKDALDVLEIKAYEGAAGITAQVIEQVEASNPVAPNTLHKLLQNCGALASTFDVLAESNPQTAAVMRVREKIWDGYVNNVEAIKKIMKEGM